ncbi:MAG TPA: dockerin, partial [Marinilabiliaceae bacterium]|nr:dockerin [Marinilabiliaceae bacterium]
WTDATDNILSTEATYNYTMPASDVTLTANFELIDHQLILNAFPEAGGTVSGDGTYNIGETVEVTATPASGYQFVNWTDATDN